MSRIDKWYTGNYSFPSMIDDFKPFTFPVLTRIFYNDEMKHYDNIDHFNLITLILSNRIINADGFRDGKEIKYVRDFYSNYFGEEKKQSAMFILNSYWERPYIESFFSDFLFEIRNNLKPNFKKQLIYYMFELSDADGEIADSESTEILKIALRIGITKKELNQIAALYVSGYIAYPERPKTKARPETRRKSTISDKDDRKYGTAHKYRKKKKKSSTKKRRTISYSNYKLSLCLRVLGLNLNSTVAQIKAAYRRLAKTNHPDQFVSLGEIHVEKATEKMSQINRAYEYIQSVKRFS